MEYGNEEVFSFAGIGMIHICISFAHIKLRGDVFQRMNNKTYCECAMKELVEVILLQSKA